MCYIYIPRRLHGSKTNTSLYISIIQEVTAARLPSARRKFPVLDDMTSSTPTATFPLPNGLSSVRLRATSAAMRSSIRCPTNANAWLPLLSESVRSRAPASCRTPEVDTATGSSRGIRLSPLSGLPYPLVFAGRTTLFPTLFKNLRAAHSHTSMLLIARETRLVEGIRFCVTQWLESHISRTRWHLLASFCNLSANLPLGPIATDFLSYVWGPLQTPRFTPVPLVERSKGPLIPIVPQRQSPPPTGLGSRSLILCPHLAFGADTGPSEDSQKTL